MTAVVEKGVYNRRGFGRALGGQPFDGGEIALEIAAGNSKAWCQVAVLAYTPVKLSAGAISDQYRRRYSRTTRRAYLQL